MLWPRWIGKADRVEEHSSFRYSHASAQKMTFQKTSTIQEITLNYPQLPQPALISLRVVLRTFVTFLRNLRGFYPEHDCMIRCLVQREMMHKKGFIKNPFRQFCDPTLHTLLPRQKLLSTVCCPTAPRFREFLHQVDIMFSAFHYVEQGLKN